ncbi:hypothetical protein PUNSTDRAFT_134838 [Punctularia strigosozonata HHB-11173 SS5]|uniref:uncharacterized protein n=1 Tax=Punctularia strigosozonata (strain HHB-11173) TaxID=741275 RepID=UPI0004416977|nr:uncharacterized protein PUNSTDRAFT_134838 [Punctularia strigosozonata HHB-11173 SS5]EIN08459.1 hypothetical protein PUNSTDRAFT_134838 [Punctularia strigosozonata HHB-11173 SS5]
MDAPPVTVPSRVAPKIPGSKATLGRAVYLKTLDQCEALTLTLLAQPHAANSVRDIKISVGSVKDSANWTILMNGSLTSIFRACQELQHLIIQDFSKEDFTNIVLPCIEAASFPRVTYLMLARGVIGQHSELVRALVRLPALHALVMQSTHVATFDNIAHDDDDKRVQILRETPERSVRVPVLVLEPHFFVDTLEWVTLAIGLKDVAHLDMAITSTHDYQFLCSMINLRGVQSISVAVDYKWYLDRRRPGAWSYQPGGVPDDLFVTFAKDIGRGRLRSLELRQRARGDTVKLHGGSWANEFLRVVPGQHLQTLVLVLHYRAGAEPWKGLDWAAVDDAVTSAHRFPVLKRLVIGLERDFLHEVEDFEAELKVTTRLLRIAMREKLPEATARSLVHVEAGSAYSDNRVPA